MKRNLSQKDRALCHELALGVLRKQIYFDKMIEKLTKKEFEKFDLEVIVALRLRNLSTFIFRQNSGLFCDK